MKFYEEWVDNSSLHLIEDFDELLKEIAYAYEPQYPIYKYNSGIYVIHKLSIGKNWTQYKQHISRLSPGVYEELDKFFQIEYEK